MIRHRDGIRHPDGRKLTPAEKRGAFLVLEELRGWGGMIAQAGHRTASRTGAVETVPLNRLMIHTGNTVCDLTRALARSIDP